MTILEFSNNVVATLAQNIPSSGAGSTTAIVSTGQGAQFPALTAGQNFIATFVAASNPTIREIVLCTARASDTLTIVRAQEGTAALAWSIGDTVNMRPTAGTMRAFLQEDQISAALVSAIDYAVDTGTANVYAAAYAPAVSALVDGLKLRIRIAHANTGASTFSPNGLSARPIKTFTNSALAGGEIPGGIELELTYNISLTAWLITSASQATESCFGSLPIATQTMVNTGTDDESTVTPLKLKSTYSGANTGAFTVGAVNAATGTQGSHGWEQLPNGRIRNWTTMQLQDGGNGTNANGSTWTLDKAFTSIITGIDGTNISGLIGSYSDPTSANAVLSVYNLSSLGAISIGCHNILGASGVGQCWFYIEVEGF